MTTKTRVTHHRSGIAWSQSRFGSQHTLCFDAAIHERMFGHQWVQRPLHPSNRRPVHCPAFYREQQAWLRMIHQGLIESCSMDFQRHVFVLNNSAGRQRQVVAEWELALVLDLAGFSTQSITLSFPSPVHRGRWLRHTIRRLTRLSRFKDVKQPREPVLIPSTFALLALGPYLNRLIKTERLPGKWHHHSPMRDHHQPSTAEGVMEGDQGQLEQRWIPAWPRSLTYRHHRHHSRRYGAEVLWYDQDGHAFIVQNRDGTYCRWPVTALHRQFELMDALKQHWHIVGGLHIAFPDLILVPRQTAP